MESFLMITDEGSDHDLDSVSSSSQVSSVASLDQSDCAEEVTSSSSSSSPNSKDEVHLASGSLNDMSSLLQQLPFKRGLSRHYNGKSQSFTCLSSVRSLEDLAKPEKSYNNNKRLKSCKSYGGLICADKSTSPPKNVFSRLIVKKASSKSSSLSCSSSLTVKRSSSGSFLMGSRPPVPPHHRSTTTVTISTHAALFA